MSALIAHEYGDSAMVVDTNITQLGNSNVTKSHTVAMKPSAAVVSANTDKGTECLQQESW